MTEQLGGLSDDGMRRLGVAMLAEALREAVPSLEIEVAEVWFHTDALPSVLRLQIDGKWRRSPGGLWTAPAVASALELIERHLDLFERWHVAPSGPVDDDEEFLDHKFHVPVSRSGPAIDAR